MILLAILIAAWFAVLFRNELIADAASDRIVDHPNLSDAEWNQAMDDFRRAELLSPATEWRMIRGQYLLLRDKREAARVAASVLRSEPDNLNAWVLSMRATEGWAPERAARARDEIRRLNPPLSPVPQ